MVKKNQKSKIVKQNDGPYVLKLVLYLIVGSQWVWFVSGDKTSQIPIPVGFVIGLMFASHEHFQIDRKIEYAVLLVAALVSFWVQIGIFINL